MDFDIVIATRNRQAVLEISLPLMLMQTRPPLQFIIVDSSDDHPRVRKIAEEAAGRTDRPFHLEVIRSGAGSSYQRNLGLKRVKAPVVLFPDDDALWFPDTAEAIMRIYECDTEGIVGGVGGIESPFPPPGVFRGNAARDRMELRDRFQLLIGRFLDSVEFKIFPDPFFIEASARFGDKAIPAWLAEEEAAPGTVLPGFRMSFRTDVIGRTGFDEALGRYALFEDYDACLNILKSHMLVDARKARVFHYRSPEKRVNGMEWGLLQVLNRTYVICKHTSPGSEARKRLNAFLYYKLARYILQAQTAYGRERVKGVFRALPSATQLMKAPEQQLSDSYLALRSRHLSES